jgi:hypothetical protein
VVLTDGEQEYRLAPIVAANVFLPPTMAQASEVIRLADSRTTGQRKWSG